jgi:hypothetical protein
MPLTEEILPMLMFALALAAQLPPEPMTVTMGRDLINDRVRATAELRQGGNRLAVICETGDEDGPRVTFHARHWLARGHLFSSRRRMTYRFDDAPPRRMFWRIRERRATLTRDVRVAAFMRDLRTARRLVIRSSDMEKRRFDAVFDLQDVGPAVDRVLQTCSGSPEAP